MIIPSKIKLSRELATIVRGTAGQRVAFIDAAIEALVAYQEAAGYVRSVRADRTPAATAERFDRIAGAVGAISRTLASLDENEVALLRRMVDRLTVDRRRRQRRPSYDGPAPLKGSGDEALEWLKSGTSLAPAILAAARSYQDGVQKTRSRSSTPLIATLVMDLRTAYETAFQKRASADDHGTFREAFQAILSAADIHDEVGRKKFKQLVA
jgi:hypothetical protein